MVVVVMVVAVAVLVIEVNVVVVTSRGSQTFGRRCRLVGPRAGRS
jgi:hypothetical protein